jgi:hypothetical protein
LGCTVPEQALCSLVQARPLLLLDAMTRKLMTGLFLTAITAMPLVARADWDNVGANKDKLEQKGTNLENKGEDLETRGKALKAEGQSDQAKAKSDEDEGRTVEKKSVTSYHNGRKYLKTKTEKTHSEPDEP